MLNLIIRKLIQGGLMVLIVAAITFVLLSAAGGDALTALRDNPQVSTETIENLRKVYGLDRPVMERFVSWLGGAFTGDLGDSLSFRVPVAGLVASRLFNTVYLSALAIALALFAALGLSIAAARFPAGRLRYVIESVVLLTVSSPRIVLALLVLMLTAMLTGTTFAIQSGSVTIFLLTALVLGGPLIGIYLAQTHEQLTLAMNEDFVQLARAKGLGEWAVILRHAIRAAINPLLTLFGLSIGALLGGSVIVETILGWPGLGALTVSAVRARDVPLVMGIVLVASVAVWFGNTVAELLQILNDKRLKPGE